ncbi:tRNA preQ1(34) S-adenosylmethionine ribosyltransferase-isomerase QueA [Kiloniella laminariae]|uniref:S-adenosylmethionine:tRNA ribosyltransferase-isomerase n=1 Tax=Kiloniella laminariae TaxID=454162 RepID=A0ABT4LE04_9PROT|nr:tRNA preQ1(34) S-adenosylmethionine ribosyltransferase-isomerase QueA [Kiloniella laminariae]MCZ4279329.1 tRNA preQ1(34) S-adenosylmethionine ribosyltransferase-isomerase QueA [Kiloniella laminariae]
MKTDLFDFDLPREVIAQRPADPRDMAKLLSVGAAFEDHHMINLPDLVQPGDLLVFNDTKVIPARLKGKRGEAGIEVTLHKQEPPSEKGGARWWTFAKPAKKLRPDDVVRFADGFSATVENKLDGGEVLLSFDLPPEELYPYLEQYGKMPLPPYIQREAGSDQHDAEDYQTRFARHKGAVAAPTASLHYTDRLMQALEERGIEHLTLTLHVGAGTFLPVKVDDIRDHKMHSEIGHITPEAAEKINAVKARGGRIIAVGTTALRLLESASEEDGTLKPFDGETDIFISPGYRFRIVDLLLTNFHLPRSTLFMLVSAFAGLDRMRAAYQYAMDNGYRFYSYGDCSLLQREDRL